MPLKVSTSPLIYALFMLFFGFFPSSNQAGGFTELSTKVGPFQLGMSSGGFRNITNISPEPCPICIDREQFASLSKDQALKIMPEFPVGSGIDFFFYNHKLYHISIGPSVNDVFLAKQDLEKQFGPGKVEKQFNRNSLLKWQEQGVVITLNYNEISNEVFSINYYDKDMKAERDWRESQALEDTQ